MKDAFQMAVDTTTHGLTLVNVCLTLVQQYNALQTMLLHDAA
jgi:hypothetical protein